MPAKILSVSVSDRIHRPVLRLKCQLKMCFIGLLFNQAERAPGREEKSANTEELLLKRVRTGRRGPWRETNSPLMLTFCDSHKLKGWERGSVQRDVKLSS